MRVGGSGQKGGAWERSVGGQLSLWVSNGARADLFRRSVLSGGQYTLSKGGEGTPGDLAINHPLAATFLSLFLVECKHYKDIELDKYLFDLTERSFLARVFKKAKEQGDAAGVVPLVVAKQNHYPAMVLMDYAIGMEACKATRIGSFRYHSLHNNTTVLTSLHHLIACVKPDRFLASVTELKPAN